MSTTRERKKKTRAYNKSIEVLTEKQAKWVELVLSGTTYREAYIQAYNPTNTDPKNLNTLVNKIRRKSHVQDALRIGQAEVNTTIILWTKEKAIVKLLNLLQKAEDDLDRYGLSKTNTDTILNSIKELNGIAGTYFKDAKKYEIDLANLEISRLRFELDRARVEGDTDEVEDDGFLEAISAAARDVWNDEEDADEKE